jgi:hypothetical protein
MKRSAFDAHDIKKCCEKKLDISFRSGKEFNGWFSLDGIRTARITIPMGRKNIPPKTYKSMATQLKLNIQQFDDLLECPLDKDGYEKIIRNTINKSSN